MIRTALVNTRTLKVIKIDDTNAPFTDVVREELGDMFGELPAPGLNEKVINIAAINGLTPSTCKCKWRFVVDADADNSPQYYCKKLHSCPIHNTGFASCKEAHDDVKAYSVALSALPEAAPELYDTVVREDDFNQILKDKVKKGEDITGLTPEDVGAVEMKLKDSVLLDWELKPDRTIDFNIRTVGSNELGAFVTPLDQPKKDKFKELTDKSIGTNKVKII